MKLHFKLHTNEDGTATLWYPYGGKLFKVVKYPNEETAWELAKRDGQIFLRGFDADR